VGRNFLETSLKLSFFLKTLKTGGLIFHLSSSLAFVSEVILLREKIVKEHLGRRENCLVFLISL